YGMPLPADIASRPWARAELNLPVDACIVGFVGRLVPQKNLPRLIDAVGRVQGVHLALVGSGPLEQTLRRRAQDRAPGRVHFLGQRDAAADLMPAFDLLCLPSTWEGLGLVLVEAMLRGVPIAGS